MATFFSFTFFLLFLLLFFVPLSLNQRWASGFGTIFFFFLIQRYGQLGLVQIKDIYYYIHTNDGQHVIIQAGLDSNMFLAFAAKGRFRICTRYFAARTVFHPPTLPSSPHTLPFWQFTFKRSFEACSHMPPDRTEIGAFELTVPALVKSMTEVSMVTVTQLSMETTTVEGACSAAATTAVGIFFFSSRTHTLANPWYSAPCDCPSNVSAFIQPVGLASDTGSGGNSHGKLVFRRILND